MAQRSLFGVNGCASNVVALGLRERDFERAATDSLAPSQGERVRVRGFLASCTARKMLKEYLTSVFVSESTCQKINAHLGCEGLLKNIAPVRLANTLVAFSAERWLSGLRHTPGKRA